MRRLTPADYRSMPWRNGGGTTTEILIEPADAALGGGFLYRLSIAEVRSDGPFSRFEGCERHIMLVEGAGMTLDGGPHGAIELRAPFEPRRFSGDWDVRGRLVAGPVRDFNVIVNAARASSSLSVETLAHRRTLPCAEGETCIVHIFEGALEGAGRGDTLVSQVPFELAPRSGAEAPARVAVARVLLREPMPTSHLI